MAAGKKFGDIGFLTATRIMHYLVQEGRADDMAEAYESVHAAVTAAVEGGERSPAGDVLESLVKASKPSQGSGEGPGRKADAFTVAACNSAKVRPLDGSDGPPRTYTWDEIKAFAASTDANVAKRAKALQASIVATAKGERARASL